MSKKILLIFLSLFTGISLFVAIPVSAQAESHSPVLATLFSDNFTEGAGKWNPYSGGGNWSVVVDGARSWYRQSLNTASMAYSTAGQTSWTDYSFEAILKATQFAPSGQVSGIGILARYTDINNFYRFWCVVDSSGIGDIQIAKRKGGSSSDLVDIPFTMVLNKEYIFKAVVNGSHLEFYLDGALVLQYDDPDPSFLKGCIGLMTNRGAAMFTEITVKDLHAAADPDADIAIDSAALTWDVIKGANTAQDSVTTNLSLPKSGANDTMISWSSNNAYISASGAVTRPLGADQPVTLTATISKAGGVSAVKEFNLLVLKEVISDITYSRVVFDKNPASIDNTDIEVIYSGTLTEIKNGTSVLAAGTDYLAGDGMITILRAYLSGFTAGNKVPLTFVFGSDSKTMNVWIQESTENFTPYCHALLDPQSIRFSVKVNGQPVYTGNFLGQNYTHFAFSGNAVVEVTCMGTGLTSVRPEDTGINPSRLGTDLIISGNTITFTINEARQYALRVNVPLSEDTGGKTDYYLFIYADALETDIPDPNASNVVNVIDFGADPTGRTECHETIDAATAACPEGGVVYFPAGKYWVDGANANKSNITYYLEPHAIVIAYEYYDGYDYDDDRPSSAFTVFGWDWDNKRTRGLHHINFMGRGIIGAAGWVIWADYTPDMVVKDLLLRCHGVQGTLGVSYIYDGHRIPALTSVNNQVPGVVKGQAGRAFQPFGCERIYVYNVKGMVLCGMNVGGSIVDYGLYVDGDWGKGGSWVYGKDSLNLDSCDNGVMELCSGVSNDDKFCSKLDDDNWDYRTGGVNKSNARNTVFSYNMKFIDCLGFGGASSGKVGSSNRISGENMLYEDMTLMCPVTIDTNVDYNLVYKDIMFKNCHIDLVRSNGNAFLSVGGATAAGIAATIKNLVFDNLTVAYVPPAPAAKNTGININLNSKYDADITFKNLKIAGQYITCVQDLIDLGMSPSIRVNNTDIFTLSGAETTESEILYLNGARTYKIAFVTDNPEPVSVTADDLKFSLDNVGYNGLPHPVVVSAASPGIGAVLVKYNNDETPPKNAGTYVVTVDVEAGEGFLETNDLWLGTYTIDPAVIEVKDFTISDKVWDGGTDAQVTVTDFAGAVEGDDVDVLASGVFYTADTGNGICVDVFFSLEGLDSGNYSLLSNSAVGTASIYELPGPAPDFYISGIETGNKQANVNFSIISANGKGYTVYLSSSGLEGSFIKYDDVNYNSKGVHIKNLINGQQYYVYIEYTDGNGGIAKSDIKSFVVIK